jgi:hypothetical protein
MFKLNLRAKEGRVGNTECRKFSTRNVTKIKAQWKWKEIKLERVHN